MAASARSGSQKLVDHGNGAPTLRYRGDSDAHIVRGLVAIVLALYSGRTPHEILATDAISVFDEFGFRDHLTPQRSNGLRSMVERDRRPTRKRRSRRRRETTIPTAVGRAKRAHL